MLHIIARDITTIIKIKVVGHFSLIVRYVELNRIMIVEARQGIE
jgi:hypothetical protein